MADPSALRNPAASPEEAARALAAKYREPLIRYFVRRGLTIETAEDCAQETFARICQAGGAHIEKPEAYLFAIAASVFTDRGRKATVRRERAHTSLENFNPAAEEPSPARVFEGKEALMRLAAILDELAPRTREMFLLNRLDGLSYTQLAARYGVTVSAVEKQMMKAIAHLNRRFRRDD
jgi:RNA polymerase sigma-70 factor (ECF subfamily)